MVLHSRKFGSDLAVLPTEKTLQLQEYAIYTQEQRATELIESAGMEIAAAERDQDSEEHRKTLETARAKMKSAREAESLNVEQRKYLAKRYESRTAAMPTYQESVYTLKKVDYENHLLAIDSKKEARGDRIVIDEATRVVDFLLPTHVIHVATTESDRDLKPADVKRLPTEIIRELAAAVEWNIAPNELKFPFYSWLSGITSQQQQPSRS